MRTVTLKNAQKSLPQLAQSVIDNIDHTLINMEDGGAVVLLSLEQFNAWQETIYLLSNPANATHLARSIAQHQAGETISRPLFEE